MKVCGDTLTSDDLYAALPADVTIAAIRPLNTHKRARGWELALQGVGLRHTRRRNSGIMGADPYGYAATWDDHGVWMDNLYRIDPDALIAFYTSRHDFLEKTRHEAQWRQRSRFRTIRENGQAPWLRADRADRTARLNAVMAGSWGDA